MLWTARSLCFGLFESYASERRSGHILATLLLDALESAQDALESVLDALEKVPDALESVPDALESVRDALEDA